MSEGAYRYKIYATLGILTYRVEGYSPARLRLKLSANHFDGLSRVVNSKVVKHNPVHTAVSQDPAKLIDRLMKM